MPLKIAFPLSLEDRHSEKKKFNLITRILKISAFIGAEDLGVWLQFVLYFVCVFIVLPDT